jgi:hypothetical protein
MDGTLKTYSAESLQCSGLLIGNGFSQNIWNKFAYKSLFDVAKSSNDGLLHPLVNTELAVFSALQTTNFEQVLSTLGQATLVNSIFGLEAQTIQDSYERIKQALIEAVHHIHVPWESCEPALQEISDNLATYDAIYSTNYDLVVYWAMMQDSSKFTDYFFNGTSFDLGNTEVWGKVTKVLFVHGGLHLSKVRNGTVKRKAGGLNLLDSFGMPLEHYGETVPLFVSEGTSDEKLQSIYANDYLSFAYGALGHHQGPLMIIGHSLDPTYDRHLLNAIRNSQTKEFGITIYVGDRNAEAIAEEKAAWHARLPNRELHFFDSTTHPLASPSLNVQ